MRTRFGFSVIEVILSVAIISIISATLLPTIGWLVTKSSQSKSNEEASLLLQEGIEVSYNVILSNWSLTSGVYHPAIAVDGTGKSVWTLASGDESIIQAKFTRGIEVKAVCRDGNTGEVDKPGCVSDQNSKKVSAFVTWIESGKSKRVEADLLVAHLSE